MSELKNRMKKTVCLDFDGTIYSYQSGWVEPPSYLPDPPVEGAVEFCRELQEHFNLVVCSARARYDGTIPAMSEWLEKWGFPTMPIVAEKPLAFLYLDDRGFTFNGTFPTLEEVRNFKTWQEHKYIKS